MKIGDPVWVRLLRSAGFLAALILALGVIVKFPKETALRLFGGWRVVGSAKLGFVLPLEDISVSNVSEQHYKHLMFGNLAKYSVTEAPSSNPYVSSRIEDQFIGRGRCANRDDVPQWRNPSKVKIAPVWKILGIQLSVQFYPMKCFTHEQSTFDFRDDGGAFAAIREFKDRTNFLTISKRSTPEHIAFGLKVFESRLFNQQERPIGSERGLRDFGASHRSTSGKRLGSGGRFENCLLVSKSFQLTMSNKGIAGTDSNQQRGENQAEDIEPVTINAYRKYPPGYISGMLFIFGCYMSAYALLVGGGIRVYSGARLAGWLILSLGTGLLATGMLTIWLNACPWAWNWAWLRSLACSA